MDSEEDIVTDFNFFTNKSKSSSSSSSCNSTCCNRFFVKRAKCFPLDPLYSDFCTFESRYMSFIKKNWPSQIVQDCIDMAECGFFYTGESDKVVCFWCGVDIFKWAKNDDIKSKHSKMSPECNYLKLFLTPM